MIHLDSHPHMHLSIYPLTHHFTLSTNNQTPKQNPESRTSLPGIAFGDFAKRFKQPTLLEGFQDIIRVDFRFKGDEEAKKLWGQFWI
jgi:bifunctional polynucleotide phosphatase/kinase